MRISQTDVTGKLRSYSDLWHFIWTSHTVFAISKRESKYNDCILRICRWQCLQNVGHLYASLNNILCFVVRIKRVDVWSVICKMHHYLFLTIRQHRHASYDSFCRLFKVVAYCLFGVRPLPEPILVCHVWRTRPYASETVTNCIRQMSPNVSYLKQEPFCTGLKT